VDRLLSPLLFVLALALFCTAALLALSGFIDWLIHGRWPDQSLLRLGYETGLVRARWFLTQGWAGLVRNVLASVPGSVAALVLAPLCWWSARRLGSR
jgi:hypothetical protein